ncbi:glycoside hydrolase family 3 N-terminal domain-containing protein [Chitinolyticbacter albus]|uniref:glycoside hydrolase family 3 N-terminal domain-containing protein n=1 Tax=Chitinolyticbacter albus TaxID=2961951 RepID=UPI00210928D1|nr:glycoside hydrolase family 3 N-terminal domain-containing protein [Chitinolyticbacter albus]
MPGFTRLAAAALCATGALALAWCWNEPFFVAWRGPWIWPALAALAAGGWWSSIGWRHLRWLTMSVLTVAGLLLVGWHGMQRYWQWQIDEADPALVRQLGAHLMVGYTDEAALLPLLERGAIGGVFVTRRNIERMNAAQITAMISRWQALRRARQLPLLVVATDQEGGIVSRMAPPLPQQPPLRQLFAGRTDDEAVAEAYGAVQGQGLAALGIQLNFSPVIDLDWGISNPNDRYSRIGLRALGERPDEVARRARGYCAGLRRFGVDCTLKHLPGLGRVFEDTHAQSARITAPLAALQQTDLKPFRQLMSEGAGVVMLSHATATAIDPDHPASSSPGLIRDLVRGEWRYRGLLITDDLSMSAAREQAGGLAEAAVRSLNAGTDWLLIAWDPALYYPVMDRLLQAAERGELPPGRLAASQRRIAHWQSRFAVH